MADPFRLTALKALSAALKTVEFEHEGVAYDLADYTDEAGRPMERVFRGRTRFGAGDPMPMVSILEDFKAADRTHGGEGSDDTIGALPILVQGFIGDDSSHPTDIAYPFAAAVVQKILAQRMRYNFLGLGGDEPCVLDLSISDPVIRPPDGEISSVAFFYLTVRLQMVGDMKTP